MNTPPLIPPATRPAPPVADPAPGVAVLDTAVLSARLDESFDVLRDTYASAQGTGGGWYHELTRPEPGATATALGLLAFVEARRPFEHFDEGLAFLAARQSVSTEPLRDGGWATKTSLGMPVVEATAWIARFLASARCDLRPGAPDLRRAHRWLLRNQNADGGWGSMYGCPSRTWLTCLALRALVRLDPFEPAVTRGVEWLTADRTLHRPAWGPTPTAAPTVTHTAFTLLTLVEAVPDRRDERVLAAYDWLREHLDPGDGDVWIETYDVAPHGPAAKPVWRLALWHYGLPLALAALLQDPRGVPGALVGRAFRTLMREEVVDPRLGGLGGDGLSSLWTLWWRLEALNALSRPPLLRDGDLVYWLPDATVVQHAHARGRPLSSVLPGRAHRHVLRLLRRHWAALGLALVALGSLVGVAVDLWNWRDFWLSVILPIMLTVMQEAMKRRRAQQQPPSATR
ncbi:prenyltransferase/squalene oxidase repeat-containing protein [Actinomadura kijaniata]|uniref:prenyltransferase/squalene oxidase repeat-containing protein n=1 Tax=Actinomadura kijaniata TaxID=46161 RepID=UPI003F19A98E